MRVSELNFRYMRWQGLLIVLMQCFSAIPQGSIAQGLHSIGGCISSCRKVIIGNIACTKVPALLDSLEKLGISFVSRIIRALDYVINP